MGSCGIPSRRWKRVLDLGGGHGAASVGHEPGWQPALLEGLAETVREGLGFLVEVPLDVAAKPRVIVHHAEAHRIFPAAVAEQHRCPLAGVVVGVPELVGVLRLVAAHLTGK